MRTFQKIIFIWLGILTLGIILFIALPHREYDSNITPVNQALIVLLSILSFFIFKKEPNKKNKPIFLNFFFSFSAIVLWYVYLFMGRVFFTTQPYIGVYAYQYTASIFFFLFSFSIIYVVLDTLFNEFSTISKYLITFLIVGGVFFYYFHPILENPKYLYTTEDIIDYKAVSSAVDKLQQEGAIQSPSVEQIAQVVSLPAWKDGEQVGTLFKDQKIKRVAELLPYLEGSNYITLLAKPLHFNVIYMNVLSIVFIFLFFGYQYKNDPPQGAYIEKIIFLFLPYCSLEIVHFFGYIKSVEHAAYLDFYRVGQYVSLLNILLLLIFFSLRLRFITSVKGEFYERELVSDSEHISRWRDGFDSLVVRHFLNPETFHGRLFTPRPPREKT